MIVSVGVPVSKASAEPGAVTPMVNASVSAVVEVLTSAKLTVATPSAPVSTGVNTVALFLLPTAREGVTAWY